MRRINIAAALEAANLQGDAQIEDEKVFYGILSADGLQQLKTMAKIEHQEQYQLAKPNGCIRVRKKTEDDETIYILTSKCWVKGNSKKAEVEQETTEDMFGVFKAIADNGMTKTRYSITTDTGVWEYDIFYDADGNEHPWVKVDLEDSTAGLNELPVKLDQVFQDSPHNRTEELQEKVSELYKKYFTT